jgi:FixJ family two-component response regulator
MTCDGRTVSMRESGIVTLISIVDDDEDFRASMADLMRALGFTVETFPSAVDFLASPECRHTSCVIADVHMPHLSGIELHSCLEKRGQAIPMILVTAYPDESMKARALCQGVICYLTKPLSEDALLKCVRSALERPSKPAP